jgi:hypothetical protein
MYPLKEEVGMCAGLCIHPKPQVLRRYLNPTKQEEKKP